MKMNVAQAIASALDARKRCESTGNDTWFVRWDDYLDQLVDTLPSGAGIDRGTKLNPLASTERLVFDVSFHHMNEHGGYDGWTEHKVRVRASLVFDLGITISGRNRNDIKDYLGELYQEALSAEAPERDTKDD